MAVSLKDRIRFEFGGLFWQVGPDRDMTWDDAKEWVDGLGGDWRIPTRAELQGLWDSGISYDNWGPFENSGWFVWFGEVRDSSSAWGFCFDDGIELWSSRGFTCSGEQAFTLLFRRRVSVASLNNHKGFCFPRVKNILSMDSSIALSAENLLVMPLQELPSGVFCWVGRKNKRPAVQGVVLFPVIILFTNPRTDLNMVI